MPATFFVVNGLHGSNATANAQQRAILSLEPSAAFIDSLWREGVTLQAQRSQRGPLGSCLCGSPCGLALGAGFVSLLSLVGDGGFTARVSFP